MATKNIQMNLYNGSDYDVLYPQTTAAQASAVPTTRTVNGKALSSNISLTASDVSALPLTGGTISGNLTLKGSGNFGTQLNLGDGDYVHIAEPEDDIMEIKAKKVKITTSDTSSTALTWNGSAIGGGGISTPVSIANGGTGGSSASSAVYNLLNGLSSRTAAQINSYNSSTYLGGYYGSTGYKIPISSLLTYIQNNASGSGSANTGSVTIINYIGNGDTSKTFLGNYTGIILGTTRRVYIGSYGMNYVLGLESGSTVMAGEMKSSWSSTSLVLEPFAGNVPNSNGTYYYAILFD